jgi:hypothetical protein
MLTPQRRQALEKQCERLERQLRLELDLLRFEEARHTMRRILRMERVIYRRTRWW